MPEFDVAIVGLGPTGAVLANLLGLSGLRLLVLERDRDLHDLPRAVHHDGEVMRVFQTIGVADAVAQVSRVNPGMRFVDKDGRTLLDWPRPQQVGPQGWHPSWRFHQPDLDRILRARLDAWPGVEVRLGHAVEALAQDDAGVTLRCSDGDASYEVRAAYLVGCDGARSMVREVIGGGHEDLGFHERWLVADVVMTHDRPDLGDVTIQHCDPDRAVTQVRGPGLRRRWEIALRDETDAEALAEDYFWQRLARWIRPGEAEIERAAVYTFHSVIAQSWRAGRVLIAGDAAHQTPPFMGQGMCAGVRDAANLAWKLARAVRRRGDPALLDSYQSERHANVRTFIQRAVDLGRLINASDPGAALCAGFTAADGTPTIASLAPPLGPALRAGNAAHSGQLFPQSRLGDGRRLDAVAGYRFVLAASADLAGTAGGIGGLVVIDTDENPDLAAALAEFNTKAALIRPDRYILGTANRPDEVDDLLAATAQLIG